MTCERPSVIGHRKALASRHPPSPPVPPVAGADLRAALVASCFLGALPPVDLRAVCLVRAIRGKSERKR